MTIELAIPTVETDRLCLRAPKAADFEAYAAFRAGPRSVHVGGPFDRAASFNHICALAGHWHMRGYGRWIIACRDTDAALGLCGPFCPEGWLEPEIAWTVFDAAEGQGIAYEASVAARRYAYTTLNWRTAISQILPENIRSRALAKRLGATYERDFHHPNYGTLEVWRHPSPEECL